MRWEGREAALDARIAETDVLIGEKLDRNVFA